MMRKWIAVLVVLWGATLAGCGSAADGGAAQSGTVEAENAEESAVAGEMLVVSSGDAVIYPAGHFRYGTTYDEETGQALIGDGFPYLDEWKDTLESIAYAPDFAVEVRDKQSTLYMMIHGLSAGVSPADIAALPAGEYVIACDVTTRGAYVEKAGEYNSYTSVYWFKLVKE